MLQSQLTARIQDARKQSWHKACQEVNNPAKIWHKFNQLTGESKKPSPSFPSNGRVMTIADYLSPLFKDPDPLTNPIEGDPVHPITLISPDELDEAIKSLAPRKAPGRDGIPPMLIKQSGAVFRSELLSIFNESLTTTTYPQIWKTADILPIPKKQQSPRDQATLDQSASCQ
jgi:hypothetical protein